MNCKSRIFSLAAVVALVACGKPVAETSSGYPDKYETGSERQVMQLVFNDGCASWNGASIRVSTFEGYWTLSRYSSQRCTAPALFEQQFEMDSQFIGFWENTLVIDVGTADADREMYLLDGGSGERIGEIWYVGEPLFGKTGITFYEPTREQAILDECPQKREELNRWQDQGAMIMYASKKRFDLKTRNTNALEEKGCYAMR
ncbi:hypothetical protein [Microbulbifer pacificus]|uniref:hypothetical protein n=1 Tax=Microbulbifer pacificus TaxID=407164 RepID=UPI001319D544|nr:hypothetical protein [Microbulbifer pacificus]